MTFDSADFYGSALVRLDGTRTIRGEIRTRLRVSKGREEMVQHISPQQLKALIKSKSNDFLVVDVRDDDYRGGNIKGAINIPSEKFLLKLHQLIDDTQKVSKIIFHCAYSQQRCVYPTYIPSKKLQRIPKEVQKLHGYESSNTPAKACFTELS